MTLSALRRRAAKEGYRIMKHKDGYGCNGYDMEIEDLEAWFENE